MGGLEAVHVNPDEKRPFTLPIVGTMAAGSDDTSDHVALSTQRKDEADHHIPASPWRTMARPMRRHEADASDRLRSGVRTTTGRRGLCERRLGPGGIPIAHRWSNDERQHMRHLCWWEGMSTPAPLSFAVIEGVCRHGWLIRRVVSDPGREPSCGSWQARTPNAVHRPGADTPASILSGCIVKSSKPNADDKHSGNAARVRRSARTPTQTCCVRR